MNISAKLKEVRKILKFIEEIKDRKTPIWEKIPKDS